MILLCNSNFRIGNQSKMRHNLYISLGVILLLIFSCIPASNADWDTMDLPSNSMKRYLHNVDCSGFDNYNDLLTPTVWYRNCLSVKGAKWEEYSTGWNKEIWNNGYQVGHENISCFIDGKRVGFINGDRWPDMVVGTVGTDWATLPPSNMRNSIYVAINPPYGYMVGGMDWAFYYIGTLPSTEDGVETVSIGDANNDGYGDIFAGSECHEIRLYMNPGFLNLSNNWDYHILHTFDDYVYMYYENGWERSLYQDVEGSYVADFNNDGYCDIVVITASRYCTTGGVYLLLNPQTRRGDWETIRICDTSIEHFCSSCIESLTSADIDNDGLRDVVVVNQNGDPSKLWWSKNINVTHWQHPIIISNLSDTYHDGHPPEIMDVDGDGWIDVITASENEGGTFWFKNPSIPEGEWVSERITSSILHHFAVGDLFDSGSEDVIANKNCYINPY